MKTSFIVALALIFASMSTSYAQNKGERIPAKGFAVQEASGHFQPYEFTRHAVGDNDIQIDILYAGICHSDLHHVFADWGAEEYPMVPGHEIAGRVVAVGKNVTKFKVGDYAGIGCMIGSCRHCEACEQDLEQYCEEGAVMTYHGIDRFNGNEHTQGGYSNTYVVAEDFAIRVPSNADIEKVAPLMCAGITAYSPLMQAGVKKGDKVGIAGFGGLGHMGVQYAVSLGADVTVFDITDDKREDALRMGATKYVNVNNPEDLKGLDRTFDFILSTIPAKYAPVMYMKMLKLNGQLGIVGLPALRNMPSLTVSELIFQGHRNVFGSQIGGIKETQEMFDYSVEHNIYPEVEVIKARGEEIDKAYRNVLDGKVKFRYVIDMHTME
jgi:uncharacterized zinc-type alcohol dehydrogenase-like protein